LSISATPPSIEKFIKDLQKFGVKMKRRQTLAFLKAGEVVVGTAKNYCPMSETADQISARLKTKEKTEQKKIDPGRLAQSIRLMSYDDKHAAIGVPSNSGAGKYASRIHDEKGSSWFKVGRGTKAKGPQADSEFITRAVEDETNAIITIFSKQIERALSDL